MRDLVEGDAVILPSGRRAQIVRFLPDDRVELHYLGANVRDLVNLPRYLVRPIARGLVPPPARVNGRRA